MNPLLTPFVAGLGYVEGGAERGWEVVLPSGTMQILVNLDADLLLSVREKMQQTRGAALQGPSFTPALIDLRHQRAIAWIAFRPGGAWPFLPAGFATADARDLLVDLEDVWGRDGAVLRERLLAAPTRAAKLHVLEDVLLTRATAPLVPDLGVRTAVAALHQGAPVGAVTDRLGWTSRRLMRVLTEQVGLSPKRFSRVRRFQRLLSASSGPIEVDWARLAADCGYHDQAHLIHEFRAFAGMTPTSYAPRSPAEHNHVRLPKSTSQAAASGATLAA